MSKSITEKELAEKLERVCESPDLPEDWQSIAREAAELLGVTLTPEKPEPGTRGVVAEGPRHGYLAVVQQGGALLMFNDYGDCYRREPHEEWPTLTPARVVPAEPVELSDSDRAFDDALRERDRMHEIADRLASLLAPSHVLGEHSSANDPWQNAIDYAKATPLAKHGHGRVEVSRDEIAAIIDRAMPEADLEGRMSASREIYALLEASK